MARGLPQAEHKTIVEASSGSTVLSLGIIARVLWGHDDVNAYVTNKKYPESLNLLRFFGVTPHLYGGLAQQEPTDETGIMCRLRRLAKKCDDIVYPGQYDNEEVGHSSPKFSSCLTSRRIGKPTKFGQDHRYFNSCQRSTSFQQQWGQEVSCISHAIHVLPSG
jgi:hypothetical protein